ncbi:MAG: DUF2478 domain-containing protein [Hyphomicrobium sp.]
MKLAAITYVHGQGEAVDQLLRELAEDLKASGLKLGGAIQWNRPSQSHSRCDMELEDLASGQRINASDKARAANSCRLDAWALEDAAGLVAASIAPGVDFVIVNRFGKQEASGQGFRATIEAAIANDLPVLTSLNVAHQAAFDAFTGGEAGLLAADREAVRAWCRSALAQDN